MFKSIAGLSFGEYWKIIELPVKVMVAWHFAAILCLVMPAIAAFVRNDADLLASFSAIGIAFVWFAYIFDGFVCIWLGARAVKKYNSTLIQAGVAGAIAGVIAAVAALVLIALSFPLAGVVYTSTFVGAMFLVGIVPVHSLFLLLGAPLGAAAGAFLQMWLSDSRGTSEKVREFFPPGPRRWLLFAAIAAFILLGLWFLYSMRKEADFSGCVCDAILLVPIALIICAKAVYDRLAGKPRA